MAYVSLGMGEYRQAQSWRRGVSLALVFAALILKILVPQGYMVATSGGSVAVVVCTGHGPLVTRGTGKSNGPIKAGADAPCAFAAGGPPIPSAVAAVIEPREFAWAIARVDRAADLVPGRGLAAPPPPAQAPPPASI
jgi:hypothetical protein